MPTPFGPITPTMPFGGRLKLKPPTSNWSPNHPALLPARQQGHLRARRRAAQRIHRLIDPAVQVPGVPMVQLLLQPAHLLQQPAGLLSPELRHIGPG
ncbi:MAG TPA: hypothetical protein VMK84_29735 [Streptosporangiaceae bacterium]|nr:hypothetical protein [Streptosporangiaceae bacterium]